MSKVSATYNVDFYSDGTDTFSYDVNEPPLSLSGSPAEIINPYFTCVNKVPAAPFMKTCELDGTQINATFAAPLPEKDIELNTAVYNLRFTLVYEN